MPNTLPFFFFLFSFYIFINFNGIMFLSLTIGSTFKIDGCRLEWHEVPFHDPNVKDAANYAVKFIGQKSNSLSPYQLLEIVLAKAKVGSSTSLILLVTFFQYLSVLSPFP